MFIEKEVDVKQITLSVLVLDWMGFEIDGIAETENEAVPCKRDNYWEPIIDVEVGTILNWKKGVVAAVMCKILQLNFKIIDSLGETLLCKEGIGKDGKPIQIPDTLSPGNSGWDSYIILDINEEGKIEDWNFNINDFV